MISIVFACVRAQLHAHANVRAQLRAPANTTIIKKLYTHHVTCETRTLREHTHTHTHTHSAAEVAAGPVI